MARRICEGCGIPPWMDCVCGGEQHIAKLLVRGSYPTATYAPATRDDDAGALEGPMLPPNHDEPF